MIPVAATLIYGIVMMIINGLSIFTGPYPFLQVRDQSVIASVAWVVGILLGMTLLSWLMARNK